MLQLKQYSVIGSGCALGALLRYAIEVLLGRISDSFAILVANLLGCFIIALVTVYFKKKWLSETMNKWLTTGFCGGLTTFSTLSASTVQLIQTGKITLAFAYLIINLLMGLLMIWLVFKMINPIKK